MLDADDARIFEQARPCLLGLAYRILGSRADAEDAVQDTFLKWENAGRADIENPAGWLTTVCTRRCLDLLRSAQRTRIDYVGTWLPEPIQTSVEIDPEARLELASSLTTAFLLMLERLTPRERAAYLLREIFDVSYPEIADTLDMDEAACRKLVSRAKSNIDQARVRHVTPMQRQEELLAAFQTAITSGTPDVLAALLSDDIQLAADGGGKVPAIAKILSGKVEVLAFMQYLHQWWGEFEWTAADINGTRALLLTTKGVIVATIGFAYDEAGKATNIFIMRNPDKLAHLEPAAAIH